MVALQRHSQNITNTYRQFFLRYNIRSTANEESSFKITDERKRNKLLVSQRVRFNVLFDGYFLCVWYNVLVPVTLKTKIK